MAMVAVTFPEPTNVLRNARTIIDQFRNTSGHRRTGENDSHIDIWIHLLNEAHPTEVVSIDNAPRNVGKA